MAVLGAAVYDPAAAVSKSCASLLALTALDTTNLRVTFTAPANGAVLVRMRGCTHGSGTSAMILFGVLDGATVRGRMAPFSVVGSSAGTQRQLREAEFLVTGLTPSNSYTWDAAYAVQVVNATAQIKYGGPTTAGLDNAFGSFEFSVWDTPNLLAGKLYDPAAVVTKATDTQIALTALDTTNLRHTFTAPASGRVLVKMDTLVTGATGTKPQVLLGVLDGATVRGRAPGGSPSAQIGTAAATDYFMQTATFLVTGLTGGNSYTWDAAYDVRLVLAASAIKYGGPNDALGPDAFGGFSYSVWAA